MDNSTIFWLGIWYLVAAAFIGSFISVFRYINMPAWRDDKGDRTCEVGYFEDSFGRVLVGPFKDDDEHEEGDAVTPHVQGSSNISGPM